MRGHPDFVPNPLPRSAALPGFDLAPLTPAEVEEDFAAVTGSAHVLEGLFGDWPQGLTLEDNLYDLAWHDREFDLARSFAWIVRDKDGTYLGCAYLFPEMGQRGTANGFLWVIDHPNRQVLMDQLQAELLAFFAERLRHPVVISWHRPQV
ncbi:hypothetical protein [Maliponia aquimaris]|uniref:N-acetyltransferase domain-containing protein n=1 Tax=Maliponia aquimaris TaxID=1673631 RepID=A0A238JYW0_9RHOB|nr:hypothetical protein [Maliponia aquimaris]SMX35840.1 hypothetical protein MAA8898_00662 [Maliponia aquimaris]